ncbi:MAG: peroxiredoxin [Alphaproteobacteria bacterium]|nr:peroxiredoxin [Alphaproteobacteria bacterium]
MTIKTGDKIPSVTLHTMTKEGPKPIASDDIFKGKKVVIFGLPGAFTPTCSAKHLPGFVKKAAALKKKGVDEVVCVSVNDPFVMGAWGKEQKTGAKVAMIADGDGNFARATGLELDLTGRGLGKRSQRFAMIVDKGVVESIDIDPPGTFEKTSAESILKKLG